MFALAARIARWLTQGDLVTWAHDVRVPPVKFLAAKPEYTPPPTDGPWLECECRAAQCPCEVEFSDRDED